VGDDAPSGRSAIVSRTSVAAGDDGRVARGAAHRELIRGFDGVELPDDDVDIRVEGLLFRFALPAGAAPGPLQLDVPAYMARIEVWTGTAWLVVDDQLAGDRDFDPFSFDFSQTHGVALPPEAIRNGNVWVRGWVVPDGPMADGIGLEVRTPPGQGA
jgi:hypothetical protein